MAMAALELGENKIELKRGVERGNGGGDEVFQLHAELGVVVVKLEHHWSGLFIGRPWRFGDTRYFCLPGLSLACSHGQTCNGGSP